MSLSAGTRLGPYEILSVFGAGAMGEVYRTTGKRRDCTVAIRVLPPKHVSSNMAWREERWQPSFVDHT